MISRHKPPAIKRLYLALAFFVPACILAAVFAFNRVFPFGDRQILIIDFYQQYYAFASELQHKLQTGGSLLWSWNIGLGMNFLAVFAYYLASPFNLLLAIVPHAYLREALTSFIVLRIGLAGLFCALALRGLHGRDSLSLVIFSTLYALCGHVLGYYWNFIWLDSLAMLPLVFWGTVSLLREGRFKLYTVALALTTLFNLLVGLYTCIFTALVFFCICIVDGVSWREFLRRLLRIALFSVIALGIAAILILPTYFSLQNSYRADSSFPTKIAWHANFLDTIGNFAPLAKSTSRSGLPNVYSGMLPVMLLGAFLLSARRTLKEKLVLSALLLFLLVSGISAQLDFIWNGFKSTLQLPARYSFMLSFLLVAAAYRTYDELDMSSPYPYIGMLLMSMLIAVCAGNGPQTSTAVWACFIAAGVYTLALVLHQRGVLNRTALSVVLLVCVAAEAGLTGYIGVKTATTTPRADYPYKEAEITALLSDMRALSPDGFYRVETSSENSTVNDPALYGYHGASMFASMANNNVVEFLHGLGVSAYPSGLRYLYNESTPLVGAFLGMRYYIAREKPMIESNTYWSLAAEENASLLYVNDMPLALGFMVDEGAAAYAGDPSDPFSAQNQLFRLATGLDEDLFDPPIDMEYVSHSNLDVYRHALGNYRYETQNAGTDSSLKWNYKLPEEGLYFAFTNIDNAEYFHTMRGDISFPTLIKRPFITPIGRFAKDESLSILSHVTTGDISGNARIYIRKINDDVWRRGYALLAARQMSIQAYSDTDINATIDAGAGGLLYTSIPYEKGWRAFVDGQEADITPLSDAMLCLTLAPGEHTLRFTYTPAGLWPGLAISAASILLFAALVLLDARRKKQPLPPPGR